MYLFFKKLQSELPSLKHFITTKEGGFSSGGFKSLNMGLHTGDISKTVIKNRKKAFSDNGIDISQAVFMNQTHSNHCQIIKKEDMGRGTINLKTAIEDCDAMITQQRGIALCALAADCSVLLIFEVKSKTLGVIHGGWKGLINGVLENTINKILSLSGSKPEDLWVGIGPLISKDNYEIGKELFTNFSKRFPVLKEDLSSSEKYLLDLRKVIFCILENKGIKKSKIDSIELCTYVETNRLYSYRKAKTCGRHCLSAWIDPS